MSASVQAQLVKFGFKGGLNYANYSGSDLQFDALTSYHGLSCRNKAGGQFLIQPELLYSTQGATYKNAVEEFRNELGYLALPYGKDLFE
jgi:hypothetical protein